MTGLASKRSPLLSILLICAASMYFYWRRVPHNIDAIAPSPLSRARPLTDLYPRWYGTRELLLHHRDPYSAAVTQEIQLAYDGREQRFAYPLYAILFLAPTVGIQFHSAQIVFWWFLAAVTGLSLAAWLSVVRVQLSPFSLIALFATVFLSVPVLQGLSLLQFGLLVAGLLSGTAAAILSGNLFLAGVLLALATIKPPLCLLPACWFLLWVSGDWRQRRPLLWGFAATLAVLVLATELLVPGWLLRYPSVLAAYAKYSDPSSLIGVFLPHFLRWPVTIGGLLATASFCWRIRRQPANSIHFVLALAFVLTLTVMIIPTAMPPYNHVLLLPAVLLIFHHWSDLRSRFFLFRLLMSLFVGIAALPWLLAPIVFLKSLISIRRLSMNFVLLPLYASLALPFAVMGLLLLLVRPCPSISRTGGLPPRSSSLGDSKLR